MTKKIAKPKKRKNKERVRIGKLSRRKGAAYELTVAKLMSEIFPGARRGIGQARSGGDIPDVEGCSYFWVQTKHEKSPSLYAALKQAETEMLTRRLQSHAPSHYTTALVVARRSGDAPSDDVAAIRLSGLLGILRDRRVSDAMARAALEGRTAMEARYKEEQATTDRLEEALLAAKGHITELEVELDLARSGSLPGRIEQREALHAETSQLGLTHPNLHPDHPGHKP